jgi:hypothetical protein
MVMMTAMLPVIIIIGTVPGRQHQHHHDRYDGHDDGDWQNAGKREPIIRKTGGSAPQLALGETRHDSFGDGLLPCLPAVRM